MTITRRIAMLTVSGCGLILILAMIGPLLPTPAGIERPGVHWLREDIALPMDVGTSCWTNNTGGYCSDAFGLPRYSAEKHVLVPGNTLELLFGEPFPDIVTVELYIVSDLETIREEVEAETDNNGRVLVTISEELNGNYTLLVSATWTLKGDRSYSGDAWYTMPVRFDQ